VIRNPSLSLVTIHVGLSRVFFSTCTLFNLLKAQDTRFCILMTYLPIDKRVSYWSRAYLEDKIEKIWLSNHTMILDASLRISHVECKSPKASRGSILVTPDLRKPVGSLRKPLNSADTSAQWRKLNRKACLIALTSLDQIVDKSFFFSPLSAGLAMRCFIANSGGLKYWKLSREHG
jgi:hypothetical protein